MASLQYFSYPGFGERRVKDTWYNSAVRIGDKIEISGQGGWDRDTEEIRPDLDAEYDQAFENVDVTIKHAGGTGWDQVYKVRTYHVALDRDALRLVVEKLKKYCPTHQPLLTVLGVEKLAGPKMHIEVEVEAYAPQK